MNIYQYKDVSKRNSLMNCSGLDLLQLEASTNSKLSAQLHPPRTLRPPRLRPASTNMYQKW